MVVGSMGLHSSIKSEVLVPYLPSGVKKWTFGPYPTLFWPSEKL